MNRLAKELIRIAEDVLENEALSVDDIDDVVSFIENDSRLYHQMTEPIIKNLHRKYVKGIYDKNLAVKAWQYLADEGVRRYNKEFGDGTNSMAWLDKASRRKIAEELCDDYEEQVMWQDK